MPRDLFLYRDRDQQLPSNNTHHQKASSSRDRVNSSNSGVSLSSAKNNKQFNGYQTIVNSDLRQYGGQYMIQSSSSSSHGGSGRKATRGLSTPSSSFVVSEDLVQSNQLKRRSTESR